MSTPSLWDGLPARWRDEERDPLLVAYVDALDLELARQHALITDVGRLWDAFRTDAALLPILAEGLGWPLDRASPEALQRKVVSLLVPLYGAKGTRPGVVQILRLFLGLECRVRAAWAESWRLGVAALGGRSAAFTAAGGETELALPLAFTPGLGALQVRRNGVPLEPHAWWETAGAISLLTRGIDADADTDQKDFDLGFSPGSAPLRVAVNGVLLAGDTYALAGPVLSLFDGLARGDRLTVWCLDVPTPLGPGDVVVVTATERDATRLAPPPPDNASPDAIWERALTLFVEVPRPLTADERKLVLRLLDVMKSGKAHIVLLEGPQAARRTPWRLGRAGLGRGTRVGRG